MRTGERAVSARSRPATATDSVRWSGRLPDGSIRRRAISSAWRCGSGRPARTAASTSANRSVRPPRVRPCSERAGPEVRTVKPAALATADGRMPDRRLADACLALEDERREPASSTFHESFDRRELIPAADDLVRHGRPRFPVRRWTRRSPGARRRSTRASSRNDGTTDTRSRPRGRARVASGASSGRARLRGRTRRRRFGRGGRHAETGADRRRASVATVAISEVDRPAVRQHRGAIA